MFYQFFCGPWLMECFVSTRVTPVPAAKTVLVFLISIILDISDDIHITIRMTKPAQTYYSIC